ncbi:hypothetical protein BLNAU_4609 [Blattamonas nauphoetae]|uniref:RRM domain-containing protein n=1 Tax=Blattamonas nauphoetae TaxID=2049346 RepID=A0ABQ9Y9F0_9EUKA|nr:hypothetical protein BLNAU_4609 [Blattamonas nauphoetae]
MPYSQTHRSSSSSNSPPPAPADSNSGFTHDNEFVSLGRDRQNPYEEEEGDKLWVGKVTDAITETVLRDAFSKYGRVVSVIRKEGYAFVKMTGNSQQAVEELNDTELVPGSSPVIVQFSRQRRDNFENYSRREPRNNRPHNPSPCLFVYGFDATRPNQDDLRREFEKFGTIVRFHVEKNFLFVEFETIPIAETALREMDGIDWDGTQLQVKYSNRSTQRSRFSNRYERSPPRRRSRSRSRSPHYERRDRERDSHRSSRYSPQRDEVERYQPRGRDSPPRRRSPPPPYSNYAPRSDQNFIPQSTRALIANTPPVRLQTLPPSPYDRPSGSSYQSQSSYSSAPYRSQHQSSYDDMHSSSHYDRGTPRSRPSRNDEIERYYPPGQSSRPSAPYGGGSTPVQPYSRPPEYDSYRSPHSSSYQHRDSYPPQHRRQYSDSRSPPPQPARGPAGYPPRNRSRSPMRGSVGERRGSMYH